MATEGPPYQNSHLSAISTFLLLFLEDGKENRKYGLHCTTIDVVPTHSYPTDSYMSKFTKSLMGGPY